MFNDLPEHIQQQVLSYLEADNFPAARDLREAFEKRISDYPNVIPSSAKDATNAGLFCNMLK